MAWWFQIPNFPWWRWVRLGFPEGGAAAHPLVSDCRRHNPKLMALPQWKQIKSYALRQRGWRVRLVVPWSQGLSHVIGTLAVKTRRVTRDSLHSARRLNGRLMSDINLHNKTCVKVDRCCYAALYGELRAKRQYEKFRGSCRGMVGCRNGCLPRGRSRAGAARGAYLQGEQRWWRFPGSVLTNPHPYLRLAGAEGGLAMKRGAPTDSGNGPLGHSYPRGYPLLFLAYTGFGITKITMITRITGIT